MNCTFLIILSVAGRAHLVQHGENFLTRTVQAAGKWHHRRKVLYCWHKIYAVCSPGFSSAYVVSQPRATIRHQPAYSSCWGPPVAVLHTFYSKGCLERCAQIIITARFICRPAAATTMTMTITLKRTTPPRREEERTNVDGNKSAFFHCKSWPSCALLELKDPLLNVLPGSGGGCSSDAVYYELAECASRGTYEQQSMGF